MRNNLQQNLQRTNLINETPSNINVKIIIKLLHTRHIIHIM